MTRNPPTCSPLDNCALSQPNRKNDCACRENARSVSDDDVNLWFGAFYIQQKQHRYPNACYDDNRDQSKVCYNVKSQKGDDRHCNKKNREKSSVSPNIRRSCHLIDNHRSS